MVGFGFGVVYLAFACGVVTAYLGIVGFAADGGRRGAVVARAGAAAGVAMVVVGFSLPSVSGFPEGTQSAWSALDPFSTGLCVVLAVLLAAYAVRPMAGGPGRATVVAGLAASMAGLVGGNAVIQSFTDRGTDPAAGLWVSSVGAAVALGAALWDLSRNAQ